MAEWIASILLAGAVSIDAFAVALSYGAENIHIPWQSAAVMTLICSGCMAASLLLGSGVGTVLPLATARWISCLVLCGIGLVKFVDSLIKIGIRRRCCFREVSFSVLHLRFILTVYADPRKADIDCSRSLSPAEAVTLSLALSFDGVAAGFGSGLSVACPLVSVIGVLLFTLFCVEGGAWLGGRLRRKIRGDLSWISGAVLMILGIMRI